MKRRFSKGTIAMIVAVCGMLIAGIWTTASHAAGPRDCNTNSIINCGALTASELTQKYTQDRTDEFKAIYDSYGISADMIVAGAPLGEVHKDGTVTLNGQVVATNAMSIGRHNMAGSTPVTIGGKTYYNSPPSTSFLSDSISAFIFLDHSGQFIGAILTSCGNPVSATPVKKTPPPPPAPTFTCDSLTKNAISRSEYSFTATASTSGGATVVSYLYDFGDGKSETSAAKTISHTYENPGDYTAKVMVNVKVNNQTMPVTSPNCQVMLTVKEQAMFQCDSLSARLIQADNRTYQYDLAFTAQGGATLKSVDYDFGDGLGRENVSADETKNVTHSYAKAGTYITTAVLHFMVDKTVKDDNCQVTITANAVTPPPPPELPKTGPLNFVGLGLGLGSLIAAGWYWLASRRHLMVALMES